MKKNKTTNQYSSILMLTLICLMCISTQVYGQNARSVKAIERQVTGTWAMDLGKSKSKMTEDKKSALNDLDTQTRARIEAKYKNRELIFREDKSFSITINGDEVVSGEWEIAPNGKRIVVVPERGENYRYDIVSVSANRLRIKPRVKSENNLLFPEWHLVKK